MPLFTIASNGIPAPWPVAVYHGQRIRYQITFTDLTNLTDWTIQAAISDHRGISRLVEADIDITEISMPQVPSDACIWLVLHASGVNSGEIRGALTMLQG